MSVSQLITFAIFPFVAFATSTWATKTSVEVGCEDGLTNFKSATEDVVLGRHGKSIYYLEFNKQRFLVDSSQGVEKILDQLQGSGQPTIALTLFNIDKEKMETVEYTNRVKNGVGGYYTTTTQGTTSQFSEWSRKMKGSSFGSWDYFGKFKEASDYAYNLKTNGQPSLADQLSGLRSLALNEHQQPAGRALKQAEIKFVNKQVQSMIQDQLLEPKMFRHMIKKILQEVVRRGGSIHFNIDPDDEKFFRDLARLTPIKRNAVVESLYNDMLNGEIDEDTYNDYDGGLTRLELLTVLKDKGLFERAIFYRNYEFQPISETEALGLYLGN